MAAVVRMVVVAVAVERGYEDFIPAQQCRRRLQHAWIQ